MKYDYNPLLDKKLQKLPNLLSDLSGWTKGTTTILAGNTSDTVAHGLGSAPTVLITPYSIEAAMYYVDTVTAISFDVNLLTPQDVDCDFAWMAFL